MNAETLFTTLCMALDGGLQTNSLKPISDRHNYAILPAETTYTDYCEVFREYRLLNNKDLVEHHEKFHHLEKLFPGTSHVFDGKIFTVLARVSKKDNKIWVRCGYKDYYDSKYVGGFEGRDCETYNLVEAIDHCEKCILTLIGNDFN